MFFVSVQPAVSPAVPSPRKGMFDCVHYYKDAMLNRFYAICNCCACCLLRFAKGVSRVAHYWIASLRQAPLACWNVLVDLGTSSNRRTKAGSHARFGRMRARPACTFPLPAHERQV